jgi:hypothetical protein
MSSGAGIQPIKATKKRRPAPLGKVWFNLIISGLLKKGQAFFF